jgi:hypothetical protein
MEMIMYCWHALKLKGVYRAAAQLCIDQICYNIIFRIVLRRHISVSRLPSLTDRKTFSHPTENRSLVACKYLTFPMTLSGPNTVLHINVEAAMLCNEKGI